ncbi:Acetyl-coenzyme A carboxylase carboxyl transferase subunit beta chloroplastic [Bienertia sinuspersici]
MDSIGPIENFSRKEDPSLTDTEKSIPSWRNSDSSSYSNVNHLVHVMDIRNFISDDTFLLLDSKGKSYSIYFDIENQIFEIDNDHSFLSELQTLKVAIFMMIVPCIILNIVGIITLIIALTVIFILKSVLGIPS